MYSSRIKSLINKGLLTSAACAAASLILTTVPAAACTLSANAEASVASPLSAIAAAMALAQANAAEASAITPKANGFAGLWDSKLIYQGQLVDEGFEAFHTDGTEILIDQSAPATDNVCLGIWEQSGSSTIKLKHPSWYFDLNGNLLGVVIIHETLTLDPDCDSFHGTVTEDVYDTHGNKIAHEEGYTIKATRITAS